jgi:hypothetical protein
VNLQSRRALLKQFAPQYREASSAQKRVLLHRPSNQAPIFDTTLDKRPKYTASSYGICYNTQMRRFLRMEDTACQEGVKPSCRRSVFHSIVYPVESPCQ